METVKSMLLYGNNKFVCCRETAEGVLLYGNKRVFYCMEMVESVLRHGNRREFYCMEAVKSGLLYWNSRTCAAVWRQWRLCCCSVSLMMAVCVYFQLSNGNIVHDIRPPDERDLPDEYTTEAIQALQSMTMNNKQDFLKWELSVWPGCLPWALFSLLLLLLDGVSRQCLWQQLSLKDVMMKCWFLNSQS